MKYSYEENSASAFYERMLGDRSPYEQRAEECALLTIQSIMMPDGDSSSSEVHQPYQSVGSRGVNNLASKLLLALLPPNYSVFRLVADDKTKSEMGANKEFQAEIDAAFGKMERETQTSIETSGIRVPVFEGIRHAIVTGNFLLHRPADKSPRMFNLKQYIVSRQANGDVMKIVVKEQVDKDNLTDKQKACLNETELSSSYQDQAYGVGKHDVCVYTCVKREDNLWKIHQEIKGQLVEGSEGTNPIDAPEFIAIRWRKIDGENYGRSFVEEYLGDLKSLESLSQSLTEGAAAISKILIGVDPNGVTKPEDLEKDSGSIIRARKDDIFFLQSEKHIDLGFANQRADAIEKRLELAFLLNTAVQRQAERVTAEEIRFVAQELEDTLGGVYSIQSNELLRPLVNRELKVLAKQGKLPMLPKDSVKIQIVAGLEALGRSHELARLDTFVRDIGSLFGPESIGKYIDPAVYLKRRATALAINVDDGLLRSTEQITQIEQAQTMTDMANSRVAPEIVKQAGLAAQQGQAPPQGQPA
jgi:hypothetical protein